MPPDAIENYNTKDHSDDLIDGVSRKFYEDFIAPGGRCTPGGKDVNTPSCFLGTIETEKNLNDEAQNSASESFRTIILDEILRSQAMQELLPNERK
jgi:hypothetical protein